MVLFNYKLTVINTGFNMKIFTFFILSFITFFTAFPMNPSNTIILTDLDDVLIQKNNIVAWNIIVGGIQQNPYNTIAYLTALHNIKKNYIRDAQGKRTRLQDKDGNAINGLTFHFLYHGMINNQFTQYVPKVINSIESSICYIEGTKIIYDYLKNEKGYTIAYATNKDRISFDISAKTLGQEFTSLAHKIFVAHPGNNKEFLQQLYNFSQQSHVPQAYTALVNNAFATTETELIHHAPQQKPHIDYYTYIRNIIGINKNIIFIDDIKENIEGFNAIKDSTVQLYGIHFKNPPQLIQQFVDLNVLTEKEGNLLKQKIINNTKQKRPIAHYAYCFLAAIVAICLYIKIT